MMLRVLIVDDERLARLALRDVLAGRDDVTVVGEADSVEAARAEIDASDPDVVFLDVKLPDGTGFELLGQIPLRAHVVFLTAFGCHALRAFDVNALDYLVKPVDARRVERALTRAKLMAKGAAAGSGELASSWPRAPTRAEVFTYEDRVCLRESGSLRFTIVAAIAFVRAADDYAEVHLATGVVSLVTQRLRYWEERLPAEFVRIHRSTLVNLRLVDRLYTAGGSWRVQLRGSAETLGVSRRHLAELKAQLTQERNEPGR